MVTVKMQIYPRTKVTALLDLQDKGDWLQHKAKPASVILIIMACKSIRFPVEKLIYESKSLDFESFTSIKPG